MKHASRARRFLHQPLLACSICLGLMLPAMASADERSVLTDQIMATAPLPCSNEALKLFNHQLLRVTLNEGLDGVREALEHDQKWSAGNENYDRVQAIMADAMTADESKPLFFLTGDSGVRDVASRWSMAELRYFAAFFSRPEGRLYWTHIMEAATCGGWLKGIDLAPFTPLQGPQKESRDRWIKQLAGTEERFNASFGQLSNDEKAAYKEASKKLGTSLSDTPKRHAAAIVAALAERLQLVMKARLTEIVAIARTYKPS